MSSTEIALIVNLQNNTVLFDKEAAMIRMRTVSGVRMRMPAKLMLIPFEYLLNAIVLIDLVRFVSAHHSYR